MQPSEIAKVTLVIYIADYLDKVAGRLAKNWKLLINPMIVAGITLVLILAEKDLGTPMLMGAVFAFMLLMAGARFLHLCVPGVLLLPVLYRLLFGVGYRRDRMLSFLNPFATEGTTGYQLVQSFLAVGSGGWFGKGLGNSELKLEYLPAAHTDFIFSIMCEEVGLFGGAIIISLFCWLLVHGVQLARVAKTHFRSLTIFGLTITICMQAFFNMAMAIGLVPTKGIALPFFSYGGSSVIMTLVMIGIILNLAAVDNTQNNLREDITHFKNRKNNMNKRFLIASGGTGGHFYPGFALGEEFKRQGCEVLFVVRKDDPAAKVLSAHGLSYKEIDFMGFPRSVNPVRHVKFVCKLVKSLLQTRQILRFFGRRWLSVRVDIFLSRLFLWRILWV